MSKFLKYGWIFLIIFACKSKQMDSGKSDLPIVENLKLIEDNEIDDFQKNRAYQLGKRVLMTCNTSKFKPFTSDEAVESVRKNTTIDKLTSTCNKFKLKYGDFKDIHLKEVYSDVKNQLTIYRFKADYQKKHTTKELRVTLNNQNQITSIKSTDWTELIK